MPQDIHPADPAHLAGRVFRYLRSLVGDAEEARDLVQEVWLRLGARPDAGEALVFTAARQCGISHLRRRATRRRVLAEDAGDEVAAAVAAPARERPDARLEETDRREALRRALGVLSEEQRSVFHLTEVEGLRYAEVAEVLGVPAGTVASRKHLAVVRLREEMRRRGHDA